MGLPARSDELAVEPSPPLRLVAPAAPTRRELASGRARRVVCWTLVSALLLNVGIGVFLWRHPGRTDPDYWTRLQRIRTRTGPAAGNPFTVFVLGSSRSLLGLIGSQLEESLTKTLRRPVVAINFSLCGGGSLQELFAWRRLERDGFRPDLLVVEIHPAMLSANRPGLDGFGEGAWPLSKLSWSDLDFVEKHAGVERPHVRRKWLCSAAVPLDHFRLNLVSELTPDLLTPEFRLGDPNLDASGQARVDDQAPPPEIRARGIDYARKEYAHSLQDFQPGPAVVWLRELLNSSRADGVPAVMLLTPEGPAFRASYGPGVWQNVEQCLDRVVAETKTPMINARKWLGEDDFHDSHHPIRSAALRYTDRLAREGITPLVLNLHSHRNPPAASY
jgi:hypothetical protein